MANAFETAMSNGMSSADIASEIQEIKDKMRCLGCDTCYHLNEYSPVCNTVIAQFSNCPYYCKRR